MWEAGAGSTGDALRADRQQSTEEVVHSVRIKLEIGVALAGQPSGTSAGPRFVNCKGKALELCALKYCQEPQTCVTLKSEPFLPFPLLPADALCSPSHLSLSTSG